MRTRHKLNSDPEKERARAGKIREAFDHYDWVKYMDDANNV